MTPAQRRAHLRIWLALGPLTLAAVIALTVLRPERPIIESTTVEPPAAETTP